jgi:outer membrane protein
MVRFWPVTTRTSPVTKVNCPLAATAFTDARQPARASVDTRVLCAGFPDNNLEDFDQVLVSGSWLRSFEAKGVPLLYLTAFGTRDEAKRKLPDGISDKGKKVGGVRSYFQYSLSPTLQLFNGLGFTIRRDSSAFARATQIEYGRDKMADLSFGVNWKFQQRCTMRAQWLYSRNDSNIAIYDYTRSEVSSTIRCDFE